MRQITMRSIIGLAAAAVAALALVFFKLSAKSIAKPGTVTFVFKNVGHVLHDFHISGKTTPLIQPGKTAKLVITFRKAGKFSYLCTVPGHAASGMKGVFTVR
jgi:uncharacterized cupredoxin-like copper-binding protein